MVAPVHGCTHTRYPKTGLVYTGYTLVFLGNVKMAAALSGIGLLASPCGEGLDTGIASALAGFSAVPFTDSFDLDEAVAAALADTQPRPLPPQLSPPGTALRAVGRADPQVHSGRPSGPVTATTCPLQPPAPVQLSFRGPPFAFAAAASGRSTGTAGHPTGPSFSESLTLIRFPESASPFPGNLSSLHCSLELQRLVDPRRCYGCCS